MRECAQIRAIRIISMMTVASLCAWAGDAQRGALAVEREGCLECHAVGGGGAGHETPPGTGAADLAENLMSTYTPSALASALWNHTPAMWRTMSAKQVGRPVARATDWEDVFTWLYSLQFSEEPAEASRGKLAFASNQCASCHAVTADGGNRPGKPVAAWAQMDDPVVLAYQLWSHASRMSKEFAERKTPWPIMTGRDFMDLTAYVQYAQHRLPETHFSLPEAADGRLVFAEKCLQCHIGPMALENRASNQTFMDLGAGMWNHAPLMATAKKPVPELTQDEMKSILAYTWETQYQGPKGNRAAGERVFETAGCVSCHRSPGDGAPMRPVMRGEFTPWSMVALSWGPARTMHQQMLDKGMSWPRLTPEDMNDLVVYLNTLPVQ